MLLSPLINLGLRIAPPRLAFRIALMRLRRWRKVEAEWLMLDELVDPVRASVDVGCNHGIYAGELGLLCPRVHAFEPQPVLAAELRRKLPRNCTVHEIALSDRSGTAVLRVPIADDGRATLHAANPVEGTELSVPLVRLDDVVHEPIGFLKIDVEGHEMSVLRGAERILREHRPTLLIESEARHQPGQPLDLFRFLASYGYSGWFLWSGERVPVEQFDLEVHQPSDETGACAAYANNFVFVAH
ncbi:MAG: FkbM family methyltransferase [Acetobacteraceae bacterium]